jgi:ligand-binding sensor domain-containing protein
VPRISLACGLSLLLPLQLAAVLSGRGLPGYSRRIWQTQDGLPEQTVQAFVQTPDRFLWIGTTGGLIRFDGSQFVVLDRDNSPYLHDNSVFCLMVSTDGSLWIGTDGGGLARYRQGVVRSYSYNEGLTNDFVRSVFQDHKGDVWVGTDDGLFRVKGEALERVDGHSGIPALAVHAIREDSRGRLWIGGSSLIMLDGTSTAEYPLEGGLGENRVKSILETSDGTLWVGTVSGLQRRERNAAGFTRVKQISSTVRALREDSGGTLWIGTIGEGIIQYRDGQFAKLTAPEYLPSDTVLSLFEDVEQNVWVGTQTGMLRLSRTPVSTYPIPDAEDSDFGTISQDRDGALWVASSHLYRLAGGGLFRISSRDNSPASKSATYSATAPANCGWEPMGTAYSGSTAGAPNTTPHGRAWSTTSFACSMRVLTAAFGSAQTKV